MLFMGEYSVELEQDGSLGLPEMIMEILRETKVTELYAEFDQNRTMLICLSNEDLDMLKTEK